MRTNILQVDVEKRGIVLDPRTKLMLLITMATFVLGNADSANVSVITPCLCAAPFILFLTAGKFYKAFRYAGIYTLMYLTFIYVCPQLSGTIGFLVLGTVGIATRFMPSVMLGVYVLSTTTVSEFTATMQKLHVSEKIVIPMSVMFRFFPTVTDEFASINAAMKMRGIALNGRNATKMLEYRFIPLMACSVKIGEELSAAALTRGLGGEVKRTNVCHIGFHVQDIMVIALCLVPFINLLMTQIGGLAG